ncbi:MAG: hypothetical protein ACYDD0_06325 [Candidatus Dormibacteria bacterium]
MDRVALQIDRIDLPTRSPGTRIGSRLCGALVTTPRLVGGSQLPEGAARAWRVDYLGSPTVAWVALRLMVPARTLWAVASSAAWAAT